MQPAPYPGGALASHIWAQPNDASTLVVINPAFLSCKKFAAWHNNTNRHGSFSELPLQPTCVLIVGKSFAQGIRLSKMCNLECHCGDFLLKCSSRPVIARNLGNGLL